MPSGSGADPVRQLQAAARAATEHLTPGTQPGRVVIYTAAGAKVVDVAVPPAPPGPPPGARAADPEPEPAAAGWAVTDAAASYDGARVRVAPSRVGLLRLLVEADGPLPVAELADGGWGPHFARTGEANVRQHVARLNAELRAALGLDFDPVEGTGQGYRLAFR